MKQFLVEYCKERKTKGHVMLQDPLSSFYEAVCVGFNWEHNIHTDDLIPNDLGSIFNTIEFFTLTCLISTIKILNFEEF